MAERKILVCDVCGSDAERIEVTRAGVKLSVDLCPDHVEPIGSLLERYGRRVQKARRTRNDMFQDLVANSPEINKSKAKNSKS